MKLLITQIIYFYSKIKSAFFTGTLIFKTRNFLSRMITTPYEVLTGYFRLSKTDFNLKESYSRMGFCFIVGKTHFHQPLILTMES